MRQDTLVAGSAAAAVGLLAFAWFALYLAQPSLGFEDTDDPSLGVEYVREHPDLYVYEGTVLILLAVALTIAVTAVSESARAKAGGWALRSSSAFGLFAAMSFLVFGAMRMGASGPLLHVAGLRQEWAETAYLVVQMAGVQGLLPAGLFGLAMWAVGLSLVGARTRVIPLAVCILGILPAVHVVGRLIGGLGVLPDVAWLFLILSIPGTMAWCLALGIAFLIRGFRSPAEPTVAPLPAAT